MVIWRYQILYYFSENYNNFEAYGVDISGLIKINRRAIEVQPSGIADL
jgi:hypothetical protein